MPTAATANKSIYSKYTLYVLIGSGFHVYYVTIIAYKVFHIEYF